MEILAIGARLIGKQGSDEVRLEFSGKPTDIGDFLETLVAANVLTDEHVRSIIGTAVVTPTSVVPPR